MPIYPTNHFVRLWVLIPMMWLLSAFATHPGDLDNTVEVTVIIENLKSEKGQVMIAMFNKK